jgi:hypothetical protein
MQVDVEVPVPLSPPSFAFKNEKVDVIQICGGC